MNKPTFAVAPNEIAGNLIVANYGASQGVDNDDGSSYYYIHDNVFYGAEGFKMDYGGHSSRFYSNLVLVMPYDGSNCINVGGFKDGAVADRFYDNTCVSGIAAAAMPSGCGSPACLDVYRRVPDMDVVGNVAQCGAGQTVLRGNKYYSPHGNGTMHCGGKQLSIADVQREFKNEIGSTAGPLPPATEALKWVKDKVASWGGTEQKQARIAVQRTHLR